MHSCSFVSDISTLKRRQKNLLGSTAIAPIRSQHNPMQWDPMRETSYCLRGSRIGQTGQRAIQRSSLLNAPAQRLTGLGKRTQRNFFSQKEFWRIHSRTMAPTL